MKKVFLAISMIAAVSFFTACGGKEKTASVKINTEMQDFMNNLNGKSASVGIALEQFGKPGLDTKDMGMYDLANPKVLEANGSCYLLECKSGMTKRKYNLCWEAGKISSIEDKGME
jgi:outer membrane lipoprotein-sorting protein